MKIRNLILSLVLTGILFTQYANSKVTTNSVRSYVVADQGILPNTNSAPHSPYSQVIGRNAIGEGYIIIFGLNLASDSGATSPQRLVSVTLTMTSTPGFDVDSSVIIDRSGTILGVTGGVGTITIPAGRRPILPPDDTGGYAGDDFFVAIRTGDNCLDGSSATFSIPALGVSVTPVLEGDVTCPGGTTVAITCEMLIGDLLPEEYDNAHSTGIPQYPSYFQWQPGEMIRPRYDHIPFDYQYAISPLTLPTVPLIHNVPQVVPWETPTAVLGIACAQRNVTPSGDPVPAIQDPGEGLNSITLTITDVGDSDFDPNNFFRNRDITFVNPENPYSIPGITLWKDTNNNGIWDPGDTLLDYQMSPFTPTGNVREWTVSLSPVLGEPDTIDDLWDGTGGKGKYDYFIVITIASSNDSGTPNVSIGGDFKIWIPRGGVLFGPLSFPQRYAGISQGQVKTTYHNLYVENICQSFVDPTDTGGAPDLTSNVIPVFGLNIASGPANLFPNEYIQRVRIDLIAYENIDPDDIAPLQENQYSGITLWRDNKNPPAQVSSVIALGNFDSTDTFIPCRFSSNPFGPYDFHWASDGYDPSVGAYRYHTYMTTSGSLTDTGYVYFDDIDPDTSTVHRGDDFFICLRTNNTLAYGSKFRIQIPWNEIILEGSKQAMSSRNFFSTLVTGNVFAKITGLVSQGATIGPQSSPTPVMKLQINDNNSGKNPSLTGLTVEFYNRGGFTLDDLAPFTTLSPWYEAGTNWYNITNFSPDALKQCGVVIYRGTDAGPDLNDPVIIKRYKFLTSSWFDTPTGYVFEFQNPVSIPCTLYVVIRTSSSMSAGDAFSVGIVGWGATQIDWDTWASRAIPVVDASGVLTNAFVRKVTEPFNSTLGGTLDLYATPGFDGITINWVNRTNVTQNEFISYEIWRTDSIHGETDITRISVPAGWSATSYFEAVSRQGTGGLLEGVTYNYRLVMTYSRGGTTQTVVSNRVSAKVYGFPYNMRPSKPTALASSNAIAIWFRDNTYDPYKATSWRIQRTIYGRNEFTDITTVDTIPTFYNPYLDNTVAFNVMYQYRVIAQRDANSPGSGTVESYPSDPSDRTAIYGTDSGTGPVNTPSGGGGGCFIATAAFGSPLAKEIEILRQFRDRILLEFSAGRKFVAWYYSHSPVVADYIKKHSALKIIVRTTLYPLIAFAWIVLHKIFLYFTVILLSLILLLLMRRNFLHL